MPGLHIEEVPNGPEATDSDDDMPPLIEGSESEEESDDDTASFTGYLVISHPFGYPTMNPKKTWQWLKALLGYEPGMIYSHAQVASSFTLLIHHCLTRLLLDRPPMQLL